MSRIFIADKETLDSVNSDVQKVLEEESELSKLVNECFSSLNKSNEQVVQTLGDMSTTLVDGVGSGIPPQSMKSFRATAADGECTLYFEEPDDTIIESQVVCHVKGCVVRMSADGYPNSPQEGELVIDNTDIGSYSVDGYVVSGLENDKKYYFRAFPYSDHNVFNLMDTNENKSSCTPSESEKVTVNVSTDNESELGDITITLTNETNSAHSQSYTLNGIGTHTFDVIVGEKYHISVSKVDLYVTPQQTETFTAEGGSTRTVDFQYIYAPAFADCSWELVKEISEAGIAKNVWEIGDEKTVSIDGTNYTFVILDFEHDTITGSGKAGVTIGMKNSLVDTRPMNSSNTNVGGWSSSEIRSWLSDTLLPKLPDDLKNVIKAVDKKTSAGNQSTTINTTSDKLWLFAEIEVFGSTTYSLAGEGTQYPYFATASKRIKTLGDAGSAYLWWERSPYASNTTDFCSVRSDGGANIYTASISRGVSFGFCI